MCNVLYHLKYWSTLSSYFIFNVKMVRVISYALLLSCLQWISSAPLENVKGSSLESTGERLSTESYLKGLHKGIDGMITGIAARLQATDGQRSEVKNMKCMLDNMETSNPSYLSPGTKEHAAKKFYTYEGLSAAGYLKGLRDKIGDMVARIQSAEDHPAVKTLLCMLDSIENSTTFYFPIGTNKNVAKRYYPGYEYTFIGFGLRSTYVTAITSHKNTLEECLGWCFSKRADGNIYEDVQYHISTKTCSCLKNARGHKVSPLYLHYKYIPTK